MIETYLFQRRNFEIKEFWLDEFGVKVVNKKLQENQEYHIKYEELGNNIYRKVEKGHNFAAYLFISMIVSVVLFALGSYLFGEYRDAAGLTSVAILTAPIAILAYLHRNKRLIYIMGGNQYLEFFSDRPSLEIVNRFIEEILARRVMRMKAKFARIDKYGSCEEQKSRFAWLRETSIITEQEYEDLMNQLISGKIESKIGFK